MSFAGGMVYFGRTKKCSPERFWPREGSVNGPSPKALPTPSRALRTGSQAASAAPPAPRVHSSCPCPVPRTLDKLIQKRCPGSPRAVSDLRGDLRGNRRCARRRGLVRPSPEHGGRDGRPRQQRLRRRVAAGGPGRRHATPTKTPKSVRNSRAT